jgi:hypothetical protein
MRFLSEKGRSAFSADSLTPSSINQPDRHTNAGILIFLISGRASHVKSRGVDIPRYENMAIHVYCKYQGTSLRLTSPSLPS